MREIKFRAWNKKDLTMQSWASIRGGQIKWLVGNDELIPMQFTGLLDKNGKEIYEGDICNCWDWGSEVKLLTTSVVVWSNDDKGWGLRPDPTDGDRYDLFRSIEIIGNIHENPELLK